VTSAADPNATGCSCGEGLHYQSDESRRIMMMLVEALGSTVPVRVLGEGDRFDVPRHYIALHGLRASELPELAERYGWTKRR
jgi:hypothetical protein